MKKHLLSPILLLLTLPLASSLNAQWFDLSSPGVPRTAEGSVNSSAPALRTAEGGIDISGVWVPSDARGSLFDKDKLQPWALDVIAEREEGFFGAEPRFLCLPSGPGSYAAGPSVGGIRRIVQHSDYIAVLNPDMTYRQVYMDGRELEDIPLLPAWMGYSAAHWDGDILVIESNGYHERTWLTREGVPHTDQLRITERYNRLDYGNIDLQITYDDPGTFTEPLQASIHLVNRPDSGMLEVICNESETGRNHYGGEITDAEEKTIEISADTLASYVGTYQGEWLGNLITTEVVIEDGEMFLIRTPRYSDAGGNTNSAKSRMIPQSQTAFECTCGLGFIFIVDENGVATEVDEVHVSGRWPFKRVD